MRVLIAIAAIIVVAAAGAFVEAGRKGQSDRTQEGEPRTVSSRIERIMPEADGRVPVALPVRAQLFFVDRSDGDFDVKVARLQDAYGTHRQLRLTYLEYSGRITDVASPD